MNEIVNKFLLAGDKFMPEMNLRQSEFTYFACGLFTKLKKRIQKFMQTGDKDKLGFAHDAAYSDRTQSDKILKDKTFVIAKNPKYDGHQRGLASVVYTLFDKKSKGSGIKTEIKENQNLPNGLHKPIIRKFKKRKVYSSFKDNVWDIDLADMQIISKYNKGITYLLCAIDLFSKYGWVVSLQDKKGTTIINAFQSILNN